jgi:hypothetical protein
MVGFEKYRAILEGKLVTIDKILGKQKYMAGDVSVELGSMVYFPLMHLV